MKSLFIISILFFLQCAAFGQGKIAVRKYFNYSNKVFEPGEIKILNRNALTYKSTLPRKENSYPSLDSLARFLQLNRSLKIEIGYYSDTSTNLNLILKFSQMRADWIAGYLEVKGISKERLSSVGYGPKSPIYPNRNRNGTINKESSIRNRRAEIKIISTQ